MASKLNLEGNLLLEQPFARIPYENFRKVAKTTQKYVERDLGAVQASAGELVKLSTKENGAETMEASIDAMILKVEGLRQKLTQLNENSGVPTLRVLRKRLKHIQDLESMTSTESPEFSDWANMRLDRWIVDWALRNGRMETAKSIARSKNIDEYVDIDLFLEIQRIESALLRHNCSEALSWCSENKTTLKKIKSSLEFELRLQEFIELARSRKTREAMLYSKKHLAPWKDTQAKQIIRCTALLSVPEQTAFGPYKRLYAAKRWETLASLFRNTAYALNALPSSPPLNMALYAGLSALKLPACMDTSHNNKNLDCPTCDQKGLGVLAKEVPFSHHVNSTIVCRLSGKIMNEDNPPMAFPDTGFVYSRDALKDMAAKNNDTVTCPRSGRTCAFADLRKLYIS